MAPANFILTIEREPALEHATRMMELAIRMAELIPEWMTVERDEIQNQLSEAATELLRSVNAKPRS